MTSRSYLAPALALIAGLVGGYALREPFAAQQPLRLVEDSTPGGASLDEAVVLRLAAALEALERRLGAPRVAADRPVAGEAPVREPLGEPQPFDTSEVVEVLRSIDARLAKLGSGGGLDTTSLTLGRPSEKRAAWLELSDRKEPMRPAELERFFREHLAEFTGELSTDLYFVEPWDMIRQFGWPSEIERGSVDSGYWQISYDGLDIRSDLEETPIQTLRFSFLHNQLNDLSYRND